jgi:hypothetical protein
VKLVLDRGDDLFVYKRVQNGWGILRPAGLRSSVTWQGSMK